MVGLTVGVGVLTLLWRAPFRFYLQGWNRGSKDVLCWDDIFSQDRKFWDYFFVNDEKEHMCGRKSNGAFDITCILSANVLTVGISVLFYFTVVTEVLAEFEVAISWQYKPCALSLNFTEPECLRTLNTLPALLSNLTR